MSAYYLQTRLFHKQRMYLFKINKSHTSVNSSFIKEDLLYHNMVNFSS